MENINEKMQSAIENRHKKQYRFTELMTNESIEVDSCSEAERHFKLKKGTLKINKAISVGESLSLYNNTYVLVKLVDKRITEELKELIIEFYKSRPMGLQEVSKIFNISSIMASKILNGIPKHSKTKIFNPNLNEDYFETIDTQEKAYFLGLIIADGNIFDPINSTHHGSKWVSITLDEGDLYILEKFKEEVGLSSVVASDGRGARYVAVRSDKMAEDLAKYYIVPRKSFITQFPFNVPKDMYRHVIRGILDGDGNVQAKSYIPKDGRIRFKHQMSFCGSHRLMVELSDILNEMIDIKGNLKIYDYKNRHLSELVLRNTHNMRNFGLWIYDGATIFMKRKRELFDKFMEHYKLSYDIANVDDCGTITHPEIEET